MSKRKRNFFSYFILFMFTWQLGLLCTAFFFDSPSELKHLSTLTDDSEDEEDAPTSEDSEESEIDVFKAIHDDDDLLSTFAMFSPSENPLVFTNQNEWSLYHVDFSTPYSPPEMM